MHASSLPPDLAAASRGSASAVAGFQSIVEHAPHAIVRFDRAGRVTYVNPAAEEVLGVGGADLAGKTCGEIEREQAIALPWDGPVREAIGGGLPGTVEWEMGGPAAARRIRARVVPELAGGGVAGALVYADDVTEQARIRERLAREAGHDALSGVLNRASFLRALGDACTARDEPGGRGFAVLFIDLDRFKSINDHYGHAAGDQLLRVVGRRLLASVRPTDVVGRLGGDEFAVLLHGAEHPAQAAGAVQRIQRRLAEPVSVGGSEMGVTASVGVALGSSIRTPEDVLAGADRAMYQAKRFGPGEYDVLDDAAVVHESAVLGLERDLERAIDHDELVVHYQPIVALLDSRLIGLEALVRWRHPERGLIGPQAFLPVAEQSSMIVRVDRWVLRSVAAQLRAWRASLGAAALVPVSVNVSAHHAVRPDLPDVLRRVTAEFGIDPGLLVMEVTETALMDATEASASALTRVREAGIRICLDDFGTGYSSLGYLRQFTFDVLKIDRSFVQRMERGRADRAIVRSVVRLAHTLGLTVIAEGVETRRQREVLRRVGCAYGQGFLFGAPVPAEEAEARLAAAAVMPAGR